MLTKDQEYQILEAKMLAYKALCENLNAKDIALKLIKGRLITYSPDTNNRLVREIRDILSNTGE